MGFFMPAEEGKKPHPNTGRQAYRIPEERKAAARVLYESTPGMTQDMVADEVGVSRRSVEEWVRKEGWNKAPLLPPTGMTEAAQAVADRYTGKLTEYGDDISAEQKQVALQQTAVETAVELRAQLIDRHRREWAAPRKLAYEAIQKRDFELAKLAKISSETLRNIQDGERKSWNIDKPEDDGSKGVTVVIERN